MAWKSAAERKAETRKRKRNDKLRNSDEFMKFMCDTPSTSKTTDEEKFQTFLQLRSSVSSVHINEAESAKKYCNSKIKQCENDCAINSISIPMPKNLPIVHEDFVNIMPETNQNDKPRINENTMFAKKEQALEERKRNAAEEIKIDVITRFISPTPPLLNFVSKLIPIIGTSFIYLYLNGF